ILYEFIVNVSFSFDDIIQSIENSKKFVTLSMAELLKVARLLAVARNIKVNIEKVNCPDIELIFDYTNKIFTNNQLEKDIEKSILNENEMDDNASAELHRIRTAIKKANDNIRKKLNSYLTSPTFQNALQDNIITMRENRYVIPVKSECRSQIPGLIHDQSASGATVFIEPFVIVEMNNDLKSLILAEQTEIEKILRDFTFQVQGMADFLLQNYQIMTELDVIFCKAKFARAYKCVEPILNKKGYVKIVNGRHPLINKDVVVPVSLYFGDKFSILLITGPNTGGKTVTLKLAGLFSLLAQTGMFLPASEVEIAVFDSVFCDIGDEQSIEQCLSTFSSHISNLVNITNNINDKSLVLLDEVGAGTDPTEGSALAISVVEFILKSKAKAVITTHYNELKEYSFSNEQIENASMDFNPKTFAPTYKLLIGIAGSSNAIQIASKLGLNNSIIERAKSFISQEKLTFEQVLHSAENARRKAEDDSMDIIKMKAEIKDNLIKTENERNKIQQIREKLNVSVQKEAKELLKDYMSEAENLLDEIKKLADAPTDADVFTVRKLKKQLERMDFDKEENEDIIIRDDSKICVGDRVFIKSLKNEGTICNINIKKSEYTLKIGIITTTLPFKDVYKIKAKPVKSDNFVYVTKEFSAEPCPLELNIIGKNCEEAETMLDKYFDQVSLSGIKTVRIVHGKGMGILKKAVHAYLRKLTCVEEFRLGKYGEGEDGVTIVTLK
ncbi:MAG: endonuclease MutS2, partial [Clostridia bacterium]